MPSCLQAYANSKNVKIVGDMPIYVGAQSADVWAHQELFELDDSGAAVNVAGVPPDAFSETGQLWGNPLYDWPVWVISCNESQDGWLTWQLSCFLCIACCFLAVLGGQQYNCSTASKPSVSCKGLSCLTHMAEPPFQIGQLGVNIPMPMPMLELLFRVSQLLA